MNIHAIARAMADDIGLINITREALCRRADIPPGSFYQHAPGHTFASFIESLRVPSDDSVPVDRSRTNPTLRRSSILASAICLAVEIGYTSMTRAQVAERAGVSGSLVTRYFSTMDELRAAVMEAAVIKDIPRLIAQGLAVSDPVAGMASTALKRRAARALSKT